MSLVVGKYLQLLQIFFRGYYCADIRDYNITNLPASIPVGQSEVCFQLVGVDDTIVENDEGFTLVIEATNFNDAVLSNATVIISDNERKEFYDTV